MILDLVIVLMVLMVLKKIPQLNLLSEWRSSGADTRKGGWDILDVFPIRPLD